MRNLCKYLGLTIALLISSAAMAGTTYVLDGVNNTVLPPTVTSPFMVTLVSTYKSELIFNKYELPLSGEGFTVNCDAPRKTGTNSSQTCVITLIPNSNNHTAKVTINQTNQNGYRKGQYGFVPNRTISQVTTTLTAGNGQ